MNVQELVALGIGFIQGIFLIPFVLLLPSFLTEKVMDWKKNVYLPFWRYIINLSGILFFIIAFFGIGWIWIDLLSINGPRGGLSKFWGQSMFIGMLFFYCTAIVEEEFRKRKSKKK